MVAVGAILTYKYRDQIKNYFSSKKDNANRGVSGNIPNQPIVNELGNDVEMREVDPMNKPELRNIQPINLVDNQLGDNPLEMNKGNHSKDNKIGLSMIDEEEKQNLSMAIPNNKVTKINEVRVLKHEIGGDEKIIR